MKEWHRTVILVLLLTAAIVIIIMSRQASITNLTPGV